MTSADLLPFHLICACCGSEDQPSTAKACTYCGQDPDADMRPCRECEDSTGNPTGEVRYATDRSGQDDYLATCPNCNGSREEPAPFWEERQADRAAIGKAAAA